MNVERSSTRVIGRMPSNGNNRRLAPGAGG